MPEGPEIFIFTQELNRWIVGGELIELNFLGGRYVDDL